jgi:predicted amidohydrolase YtcJ
VREEYMIERQGKRFVLYAGLLEEAHSRGLRSIETELLQVPQSENGEVAIVRAVVRTEDGKFTGIGDASPENVNRTIAPHVIRMAETRAKARALRDAINVGVTAFEELGGEDGNEVVATTTSSPQVYDQDTQQARAQREEGRGELPATKKQLNYLEALISDVVEEGVGRFEEMVGKPVNELTREEASEWISRLSGRAA